MDREPLVSGQLDAGIRFLQEFHQFAPVQTAFWVQEPNRRRWHLYVTSERISEDSVEKCYGEVVRLILQMQDPHFELGSVMLLEPTAPLAQAVRDMRERFRGSAPIQLRDVVLGGKSLDAIYIYPASVTDPGNRKAS